MAVFISRGPCQTQACGEEYAKTLKSGVARGLGVEEEVLSPTYAYMNDYGGKLYHFDCYRLKDGGQAEALGLCDYFYAGGVCVIEWAENISSVLPDNCKTVTIEKTGGEERKIIL